jgi:hypothetical protein
MPLTTVGKIYKPALRVLATRRVIEDALVRLGLPAGSFTLDVDEERSVIRLNAPDALADVKDALIGMPLQYTIEVNQ